VPGLRHISHNDMRNRNLALVVNLLHQAAPISRAEIAQRTGINKATTSAIVRELVRRRIVVETGVRANSGDVGHPSIDLKINPDAGRVIGVEIRADCITGVVADLSPTILCRYSEDIPIHEGKEEILDRTRRIIRRTCDEAQGSKLPVLGLGLGLPGLVDIKKKILLSAPDLGLHDIPLDAVLGSSDGIPLFVGNEAHFSALGESYFGELRASETSLYLSIGMSISGGILVNENVMPGASGLAGNFGHMVVDPAGELCPCGIQGCWDTLASQKALYRRIELQAANGGPSLVPTSGRQDLRSLNLALILQAAAAGDRLVLDALHETGRWLGRGIANLINVISPEYLVLGGPLTAAYPYLQDSIDQEISRRTLRWHREGCKITLARYRDDACLIGAVATIFWNVLNDPETARRTLGQRLTLR